MFDPGGSVDMAGKIKKKKNCKRRFSEEQVKSLETMFENETKLEPRQKAEVASQLGLHPRQVAIWFQNKRARWKSKQLEYDFDVLRRSYDSLVSRFDLLKKENQSLSLQVQNLKNLLGDDTQEDTKVGVPDVGSYVTTTTDRESELICNSHRKKKMKSTGVEEDEGKPGLADIGGSDCMNTNYLAMEEFLTMGEPACSSLTSDEEWHGLQSDSLFEQSPSSCEWWDFWT